MAKQIIAAATPRDSATVHALALSVFEELTQELDKTYCVASASASYCSATNDEVNENLFRVIEDRLRGTDLRKTLLKQINALAVLAGVSLDTTSQ